MSQSQTSLRVRADERRTISDAAHVSGRSVIPPRDHPNKSKPDVRTCAVCGEEFDMRDLDHAHHHTDEPHERLKR